MNRVFIINTMRTAIKFSLRMANILPTIKKVLFSREGRGMMSEDMRLDLRMDN